MSSKYLIIGLGNPGEDYFKTRHNVGQQAVDVLAEKLIQNGSKPKWELRKYQKAEICQVAPEIVLAKPNTFMNESGRAVEKLVKWYQPESLMLIYDDLDLKFGEFKIQENKTPKNHNGVQSVITHLRSDQFMSVRIGIDARTPEQRLQVSGSDYVLAKFSQVETKQLESTLDRVAQDVVRYLGDTTPYLR